jgi:hypothetical protein
MSENTAMQTLIMRLGGRISPHPDEGSLLRGYIPV